jgi:iron complex outermembrane recepter protein
MNLIRSRKFAAGLSLLVSATGLTAVAQTAPAAQEEPQELERFVVTGSYIPTSETAFTAGIAPVVRLDRKVIDQSGLTTPAELLQRVTVSNGGSVPISNNATGFTPAATSVSLRGLGPEATLVLINGRRVAPYPVGTGGTTAFVDLNSISLSAVDSIEILKEGASALYGADAVAGVVNIKMRRSADGTEAMVMYGNTTEKDSSEVTASLVTGAQSERANVLVGVNYYSKKAINHADRSYSAIPPFLSTNSSPLNLQITREAALEAGVPASQLPASGNLFYANSGTSSNNNGQLPASQYTFTSGRASTYNFNETAMSYPERKNMGMFTFAERKIFGTDNISAYLDLSYQNAKTENQLAPSATGNFSGAGTELVIPARTATPLPLSASRDRAAPAGAYNPFNPFNVDITGGTRARLAEFGNRIYRNETDAALFTIGLKGDSILEKWNFDAGYSYSEVQDTARNTLVSASRFNRLLNAADPIFDPTSSEYVGTTTPYNPFGYYRNPIPNNSLLVDYAKITTKDVNTSKLMQYNFVISTSELFELPAGAVGFAFGADWRQEQLDQFPDAYGLTGDLIGSSANAITRGQRKIAGGFAEARLPLVKGAPGAHDLSADLSVRHEEFLTSDRDVTVPKVGVRWQPIDDTLTVRASWSEGFREPSLYELYSTPTAFLDTVVNPTNGIGNPEQDATVRGNRRLEAEETEFINAGVVWSPEFRAVKGLTLSVDHWRVERDGTVDLDVQNTVDRFFGVAPGGLLPGESVELFPDGEIRLVNSVFFNRGRTEARGWDFGANYVFNTDSIGRFEFNTVWTKVDTYKQADSPGEPLEEFVGQPTDINTAEDAILEWKGRVSVEWAFRGFTVYVGANYLDGFTDYLDDNPPFFERTPEEEFQVKSTWIFDAQVSYAFRNRWAPWLSDTKVTLGARNLFDKDPPFASGGYNNATAYPSFIYNSEGQFVYLSLSRKF